MGDTDCQFHSSFCINSLTVLCYFVNTCPHLYQIKSTNAKVTPLAVQFPNQQWHIKVQVPALPQAMYN